MAFGYLKKLKQLKQQLDHLTRLTNDGRSVNIASFLEQRLYQNPKYQNSNRLNLFEQQSFSQFGEDGIIREIFNRIGATNKYFIEFGVENGLENNTLNLLYKDWNGLWIEGSNNFYKEINLRFEDLITAGKLTVKNAFITAENIEKLFEEAGCPAEPDLLSIDIDNNDYYVWQAISNYRPRVVVIEYNATFDPDTHFVIPYQPNRTWDGGNYFGSSLLALQQLADSKGYCLVGCTFGGNNAFFVRKDFVGDKFEAPYTAANHYEPARYYLYHKLGHPPNKLTE